jgi:hypothetical protein
VSVVATGIDDEAVVTQNTIVPNARRAADGYAGPMAPRRNLGESPLAASPVDPRAPALTDSLSAYDARPMFGPEEGDVDAEPRKGFSLFGWMKGGEAPPPARPEPRRAEAEPDPGLDEELEIPAFLRRQMTQR